MERLLKEVDGNVLCVKFLTRFAISWKPCLCYKVRYT